MSRHTIKFTPRLMQAANAAQYLGMSASKLRTLTIPTKTDEGNVWYDVRDLDAWADNLPYVGEQVRGSTCKNVFGRQAS